MQQPEISTVEYKGSIIVMLFKYGFAHTQVVFVLE